MKRVVVLLNMQRMINGHRMGDLCEERQYAEYTGNRQKCSLWLYLKVRTVWLCTVTNWHCNYSNCSVACTSEPLSARVPFGWEWSDLARTDDKKTFRKSATCDETMQIWSAAQRCHKSCQRSMHSPYSWKYRKKMNALTWLEKHLSCVMRKENPAADRENVRRWLAGVLRSSQAQCATLGNLSEKGKWCAELHVLSAGIEFFFNLY